VAPDDADRDIGAVVAAIMGEGRGHPSTRVIYTESHDDVANGQVRVPESITPGAADSYWAKKRTVLGSALVLTAPGIPMLFQGQELLEDRWFDDAIALDWAKSSENDGILRAHRDLIALRRARDGVTRGLRGVGLYVIRADDDAKVLAYHRWHERGPHDDVVVVANFADRTIDDLRIGFPAPGRWNVRLNLDSAVYDPEFGGHEANDLDADGDPMDGCEQSGLVSLGPYAVVVLSRED
jgi:1,4-alpha-glucan branching enzyme